MPSLEVSTPDVLCSFVQVVGCQHQAFRISCDALRLAPWWLVRCTPAMGDNFPDISSKLGAPTKKSLFERQKAEAEAKRLKAAAETAAVYEDFVKSFDNDSGNSEITPNESGRRAGGFSGYGANSAGGPGKRHFTSSGLKSGPGSLPKSGPGSLGPSPQGYGRKRPHEDFQSGRRNRSQAMFSYDDRPSRDSTDTSLAFDEDGEDEDRESRAESKAAARPTIHLSSIPPGTSSAVIKALVPLSVEDVRILPPSAPGGAIASSERKSTSAIVTLAADTPGTDIDAVVSQLQNKYLGFGFNLTISRHLSSAVLTPFSSTPALGTSNLPFNARPIPQSRINLSRAPPPSQAHNPRFAPPASYSSSTISPRVSPQQTQVIVQPPSSIATLRLIHKTLEALLTYGPEFEALLMSRGVIQTDERWAWLWDARSRAGVYYRWRLWDILTDGAARRRRGTGSGPDEVFADSALWRPPEGPTSLKFEFTTKLDEFVSEEDYDSSDEEDYGDFNDRSGLASRHNDHVHLSNTEVNADADGDADGTGYLNPLARTKLVHLLARSPDSHSRLRRGDVARVTSFAIEHAGRGAWEVVDLLCANAVRPLCCSVESGNRKLREDSHDDQENDDPESKAVGDDKKDITPAMLVGLYLISDILSSSSTSGVRHAWRYRALFESGLKRHRVFEKLGRVDREFGWGKLKAEKWKRSVMIVLGLWEGWCVFEGGSMEGFIKAFETREGANEESEKAEDAKRMRSSSNWRSVEDAAAAKMSPKGDVEMGDLDGEVMIDDDDGEQDELSAMSDVDGVPMADSSDEEMVHEGTPEEGPSPADSLTDSKSQQHTPQSQQQGRRQRPRAVDMFADNSGEE